MGWSPGGGCDEIRRGSFLKKRTKRLLFVRGARMVKVEAQPYAWPFDGDLKAENTALIVIDMQRDFCGKQA